jgi:hypothetical protein
MLSQMKSLLIAGLLATSMLPMAGCDALNPHRFCEAELADTKAQLAQTQQLANHLQAQVQEQKAELETVKKLNASNVRREKEKALNQIEAKREQLEQERWDVDRIKAMEQADLEQ